MTRARETNILVPIIGGFWVAGSVAITFAQVTSERRDVIVSGVLDGVRLSTPHREMILNHDWVPLVIVSGASCLVLAASFIFVPLALRLTGYLKMTGYICAIIPAIGMVGWWGGGVAEYGMMRSLLANQAGPSAAPAG